MKQTNFDAARRRCRGVMSNYSALPPLIFLKTHKAASETIYPSSSAWQIYGALM